MGAEMVFNYRQANENCTVSSPILAPPRFPAQVEAKDGDNSHGKRGPSSRALQPCLGHPLLFRRSRREGRGPDAVALSAR